jgi:hypothetical protein
MFDGHQSRISVGLLLVLADDDFPQYLQMNNSLILVDHHRLIAHLSQFIIRIYNCLNHPYC